LESATSNANAEEIMKKKASKPGSRILQGAREALALARGEADEKAYRIHVPAAVDVRALRRKLRLSQDQFARRFGFTAARIRDWEQGRSRPDGAVRAYLRVIERAPDTVAKALSAA
jgi:putative transcriptional regulator